MSVNRNKHVFSYFPVVFAISRSRIVSKSGKMEHSIALSFNDG